jgi:hypothetical protein
MSRTRATRLLLVAFGSAAMTPSTACAFEILRKGVIIEGGSIHRRLVNRDTGEVIKDTTQETPPEEASTFVVRGKLLVRTFSGNWRCRIDGRLTDIAIVYRLNGRHSGTVTCEPRREGTSIYWRQFAQSFSYVTTASVSGEFVTLVADYNERQHMTGNDGRGATNSVYTEVRKYRTRLRIRGNTCQVLEDSFTANGTEAGMKQGYVENDEETRRALPTPPYTCRLIE